MTVDDILQRLEKVRQVRPNEWTARCPAHADKSPSLAVREADDGRVLMHCFADCSIASITTALGVNIADLFEKPLFDHGRSLRHPFSAAAVLRVLAKEAMIVSIVGRDMQQGEVSTDDRERLVTALERLTEGARYA